MEELFYNALATAAEGNYAKLARLCKKYGSWQAAWEKERQPHNLDPEKAWRALETLGIRLVLRDAPAFPALLRETACCPFGLYVRGIFKETPHALAIVGTRKATPDGVRTAEEMAKDLGRRGATIVSGLALGIDVAAHAGALRAGAYTIAVLGNGLDRIYPATNEHIGEKILSSGGALVSEYPTGTPALPHHFLERNRVVGGLAHATLVIEAPEQSGSLVTARLALENNRQVLVVPGSIYHPNFRGSHSLIRKGAELVSSADEIAAALGMPTEESLDLEGQSNEEGELIEAMKKLGRPADADVLAEMCKQEIAAANRALSLLVLKRIVKETGGGYTLEK